MPDDSRITLALVTCDQAPLLALFLADREAQGSDIPFIVVDDGSRDGTPDLLAGLAGRDGVTVVRLGHGGIARARNAALRACRTPWIAFSDTDCRLDGDYFRRLREVPGAFGDRAAVEGMVEAPEGPAPPFRHSLRNHRGGVYATANMAFRRDLALAAGGFDEAFGNYREDVDLALRLEALHGPIPFFREWVVRHPHRPRSLAAALAGAWPGRRALIRSELRLYAKHSLAYGRVRRHQHVRGTLGEWCRKHFLASAKRCWRAFPSRGSGSGARRAWAGAAARELAAAAGEQVCIWLACMLEWERIP